MSGERQTLSLSMRRYFNRVAEMPMKIDWPLGKAHRQDAARTRQATFEALGEGCWDALWRYAYHTTGNRDDAEDLLSETLVEGFRSFAQFRGDTPFVRWMYRVMTTTRIDMVRRETRRRAESLDAMQEENSGGELPDVESDPARIVVGPMLTEPVQKALAALPEEFRAVVVLADMEQMDYSDVSRILQIPIGTVRSRLHRARNALRKSLAAYVEERW
jgi:RNA polymerase sigma-70 factor (ECF subfamily)